MSAQRSQGLNSTLLDSKAHALGNSLAVRWLGLGVLTAGARVQSLVGELRSRKLRGAAK